MFNKKPDQVLAMRVTPKDLVMRLGLGASMGRSVLPMVPAWLKQVLRFGLVGVLNTAVDALIYLLLSRSGLIPNLVLAKGFSYSVGVLNSFYWNRSWTFKSHVESRRVLLPFIVTNLLAVGLNAGLMHLALVFFGWPEAGALALATTAMFVWNFVINKFFIFK